MCLRREEQILGESELETYARLTGFSGSEEDWRQQRPGLDGKGCQVSVWGHSSISYIGVSTYIYIYILYGVLRHHIYIYIYRVMALYLI